MMRAIFFAAWQVVALGMFGAVAWADTPANPIPPPVASHSHAPPALESRYARQRLVIMGPSTPLLIEFDIRVRGGDDNFLSVNQAWQSGARKDFQSLDANDDGMVSRTELRKAMWSGRSPANPQRKSALARFIGQLTGSSDKPLPEPPGKDFDAFAEERRRELPPIELKGQAMGGDRRNRLWEMVEASNDQRLDETERKELPARLARMDVNADGVLQELELYALDNPFSLNVSPSAYPPQDAKWVAWPVGGSSASEDWQAVDDLADALMRKYPLDKNPALLNSEGWGDIVREHDENQDGQLQLQEWQTLLRSPHLPIAVYCRANLSSGRPSYTVVDGAPRIEQPEANKFLLMDELPPWESLAEHRIDAKHRSLIKIRSAGNSVHVVAPGIVVRLQGGMNAFDQLGNALPGFDNAVDKAKGYLDQMEASRQYPLNILFAVADTNGDGMLYREELEHCISTLREHAGQSADVTVQNRGRQMFDVLDTNGDAVVDLMEREAAEELLLKYDADGDGELQMLELPQCYTVQVNIGSPKLMQDYYVQGVAPTVVARATDTSAPEWFRLLDHNNDNFVERAEYPGSAAKFRKLDKDGDGRLTLDEVNDG